MTANIGGVQWSGVGTGNITKNNLFYSCGVVGLDGTLDNNVSERVGETVGANGDSCEHDLSGNPYTSVIDGSEDFMPLSGYAGENVGTDLSGTFTLDIAGNTFDDPTRDTGAYQITGSGTAVRDPKIFYISADASGDGVGTLSDPIKLAATLQDSMSRGNDTGYFQTLVKGQITAQAESLTYTSNIDSLGGLSGIVTISDDFSATGGAGSSGDSTIVADNDGTYRTVGPNFVNVDTNQIGDAGGGEVRQSVEGFILPVPQGATVDSAYFQFYAASATAGLQTKFQAELSNNPGDITSTATWELQVPDSLTVASVTHDFTMDDNTWEITGDIKTVIQEIVDLPGWVAYRKFNLFFLNVSSSALGTYESDTVGSGFYPRLRVNWTVPAAGSDSLYAASLAGAEQSPQNAFYDGTPFTLVAFADLDAEGEAHVPADGDSLYIYGASKSVNSTVTIDGLDFLIKDNGKEITVSNLVLKHAKYGVEATDALTVVHNSVGDTLQYMLRNTINNVTFENNIILGAYAASTDAVDKTNGYTNNYHAANKYDVAGDDSTLTDTDENAVTSGIDINVATYVQNVGSTTIDAGTGNRDGKQQGSARDIGIDEATAASITLDNFNGGLVYITGRTYIINWTTDGVDSVKVEYSNSVEGWTTLTEDADGAGSYSWNTTGRAADSEYLLRISWNEDSNIFDISEGTFEFVLGDIFGILVNPIIDILIDIKKSIRR